MNAAAHAGCTCPCCEGATCPYCTLLCLIKQLKHEGVHADHAALMAVKFILAQPPPPGPAVSAEIVLGKPQPPA